MVVNVYGNLFSAHFAFHPETAGIPSIPSS